MAFELVAEAVGLPLLDRIREHRPRLARHVEHAARWLRDVTEPPTDLELRTRDGASYTGVLIIEHNAPVVMLAVRHPPGKLPERPPVVTPPAVQRPLYGQRQLDPDDPIWDRDRGFYNG